MTALKYSFFFLAIISLSLTTTQLFADTLSKADIEHCTFRTAQTSTTIELKFFPHLEPNITEYVENKNRITAICNKIGILGFGSTVTELVIGISSSVMRSGTIVLSENKLYIAIAATDAMIENYLLRYLNISESFGDLLFIAENGSTTDDFQTGKLLVINVLRRFTANRLALAFPPHFTIAISPSTMKGGNIVEANDKLFISITTSEDALERYFMKYLRDY